MSEITVNEIYKEQYAHFRAMNDILYKIPPIVTAVIGGLWYFAATNQDAWLSSGVFLFSSLGSLIFIGVMARFRAAFNAYIDNINRFDGENKVSIQGATKWPSTIKLVQWLLFLAMLFSIVGAIYKAPFTIAFLSKHASANDISGPICGASVVAKP